MEWSRLWWFLRIGLTIMLTDAIVEWARLQTTVEGRYEVSLIAQLENGRLHMISGSRARRRLGHSPDART